MISLQLLFVTLIFVWIYFLWSRRRYYALTLKVPGPTGYPFIGSAMNFSHKEDIFKRIEEYFNRFGKAFLLWLGPYPFYMLSDPQLVKEVVNSPHCVNKCVYIYDLISEVMGNGIITSKNPMWSKHRKILNPGFKHNVLLSFLPVFNRESKSLLELMDTYVGAGERNILTDLSHYSLRIAQKTTMGTDKEEERNSKGHSLTQSAEYLMEMFSVVLFAPWLNNSFIRKLTGLHKPINEANSNIKRIVGNYIDSRLKTKNISTQPELLIDHALVHLKNGNFTYQNVIDESITTVLAAFETTANAIFFTLTLLAMYSEYQEKLFEDIQDLYPHTGDLEVTYEDAQKLDFLDRILNESLRVIPPVPVVGRRSLADITLSNGVSIPKGTNFLICIFHMHRSEDIWGPEAKKFNPDNFLPDNIQSKHSYAFMPFMKGIRNCIGWRYALISAKITLIKLLRNYKFSTKFRFEDLVFIDSVSMKLQEVPLLKLEKRNK